jgi:S-DNA-T family DNA segregation ATPase FtsK/SpoIIIE
MTIVGVAMPVQQRAKPTASKAGGGRVTARRPKRARDKTPRRRAPVASVISGHEGDLAALAVVTIGLVSALGSWFDKAGPVGSGLDAAAGALLGVGRLAVPIAAAAIAIATVRHSARPGRVIVGVVALAGSVLGLLHLARGAHEWPGSVDTRAVVIVTPSEPIIGHVVGVRHAGGWVGATVAEPVRAAAGGLGATALLLVVLIAAGLLITGTSITQALGGLRRLFAPVGRAMRVGATQITTLRRDRQTADPDMPILAAPAPLSARPRPVLYDGADDLAEPARDVTQARAAKQKGASEVPAPKGEQLAIDLGPGAERGPWKLPSLALLERTPVQEVDRRQIEDAGRLLEEALGSHGVETRLVGMTIGPTVTRYELELGPGVKVARVTALNKDIAYAMAAIDVRILAPIPGRSAIGIEVPNRTRHLVALGDILTSAEAKQATHPLEVGVGRDIAGRGVMLNLATTPHMLVAGATGAGKSSFINSLVTSILMRTTPDQVRLILIDPKRVEMGQYNDLPHLLTAVVTNPKKAANALSWAVREMEHRYDLFAEVGVRDIGGYNAAYDRGELRGEVDPMGEPLTTFDRLPFIVVVVDELNDLMMVAARDVEESITRIAQMARAVGIHLVIATQRPSVNVITGVIKANIPTRVAFAVSSQTDSKVILDQVGAERLVGKGDMLYLGATSNVAQRIQGAWVSEEEVRKVTAHWKRQSASGSPAYVPALGDDDDSASISLGGLVNLGGDGADDDDEILVRKAIEEVVRSQLGSTSMLQRKLKVGFARAGRLMDLLEQRGVVGPSEGPKARAVLMSVEELESLIQNDRNR